MLILAACILMCYANQCMYYKCMAAMDATRTAMTASSILVVAPLSTVYVVLTDLDHSFYGPQKVVHNTEEFSLNCRILSLNSVICISSSTTKSLLVQRSSRLITTTSRCLRRSRIRCMVPRLGSPTALSHQHPHAENIYPVIQITFLSINAIVVIVVIPLLVLFTN
ncbi:uncharacterized protein V1518DRAFT_126717 [Limtongia smithiae]|uniref:uncharacterized protein n=1 Tax=Limtongia smithiae TaxID=1125753 RepID=UPI0034CD35A4